MRACVWSAILKKWCTCPTFAFFFSIVNSDWLQHEHSISRVYEWHVIHVPYQKISCDVDQIFSNVLEIQHHMISSDEDMCYMLKFQGMFEFSPCAERFRFIQKYCLVFFFFFHFSTFQGNTSTHTEMLIKSSSSSSPSLHVFINKNKTDK